MYPVFLYTVCKNSYQRTFILFTCKMPKKHVSFTHLLKYRIAGNFCGAKHSWSSNISWLIFFVVAP